MIEATFEVDQGRNTELSSLLDKACKDNSVPSWNLALVLQGLSRAPVKPMHLADFDYLSPTFIETQHGCTQENGQWHYISISKSLFTGNSSK